MPPATTSYCKDRVTPLIAAVIRGLEDVVAVLLESMDINVDCLTGAVCV